MTASAPWIASSDPAETKPRSAKRAVALNRFDGVHGARWLKSTPPSRDPCDAALIDMDAADEGARYQPSVHVRSTWCAWI